jgi:2-polyprenyl-3-methyl-5-hydroxy-6-metoxy-1,4-benzoquinol methylase
MATDQTSQFFDRYATDFDAIYGNQSNVINRVINRFFRQSMRERFELTLAGCMPVAGCSVLDVGCGPGHYAIELARRGAAEVTGIDFADGMLEIASARAEREGVKDRCRFERADFLEWNPGNKYEYVILMGFMDYMREPREIIAKALSLTRRRAFFSFPLGNGILAWQRRLRYRSRCELYMYTPEQIASLFRPIPNIQFKIQNISRDLFVSAQPTNT